MHIYTSAGSQWAPAISNVLNGSWNQIAYTLSNGTATCYLNGVSVGTGTYNPGNVDGFGAPCLGFWAR